jgi:hypothetical protein
VDLIAMRCGSASGRIKADMVGDESLKAELRSHADIRGSREQIIALMAHPAEIRAVVESGGHREAWIMESGPVSRAFDLISAARGRRSPSRAGLSRAEWRALGYEQRETLGIYGPGSLAFALGERLCRFLGQPHLADRCRIAMLRALVTAGPIQVGRIRIRHYSRSGADHDPG